MIGVIRENEIIGQIHLDSMPFPDSDGWQDVQVAIQNPVGRLGQAIGQSGPIDVASADSPGAIGHSTIRETGDQTQGCRQTKDLEVMIVDLVAGSSRRFD
jgi:hypothetical protein